MVNPPNASGINDAGQVVGYSVTAEGVYRGFITGPDGIGMRDMGPGVGYGINNAGQVVGSSGFHAFITGPDGMGMRNLGTLGDDLVRSDSSAFDINNAGQVVGYSTSFRDGLEVYKRAFITGPNGTDMRDLGFTIGGESEANGINDAGQVVGESYTAEGDTRAFISPDGKGMVDLNSLVDLPDGVILTQAAGINNNGQVIAMGVIPEPETYALMLAGLGLIGLMGRRRKAEELALVSLVKG